jgi:hypothetical protein
VKCLCRLYHLLARIVDAIAVCPTYSDRKPTDARSAEGTTLHNTRANFRLETVRPIGFEYSVAKETGKMLGTLVASAVARMVNLETFIWDIPTGVVREVWIALASLADRPGHDCRLENVRIRWPEIFTSDKDQ